jgi:hypothetical protein
MNYTTGGAGATEFFFSEYGAIAEVQGIAAVLFLKYRSIA